MFRSRWIWIVVIFLVIVVTGLLAGQWAINRYLSPEGVSRQLSSVLEREVNIEQTHFSFWSGIQLDRVEISEYPGFQSGRMLRAESLSLHPQWWDLVFGNVIIRKATIYKPQLNLNRNQQGEWNLLRGMGFDSDTTSANRPLNAGVSAGSSNMTMEVQQLSLIDGLVHLSDESSGISEAIPFEQLQVRNFSLNQGADLSLQSLQGMGGDLSAAGRISMNPISFELESGRLRWPDLSKIKPELIFGEGEAPELQGQVDLNFNDGIIRADSVSIELETRIKNFRSEWPDGNIAGLGSFSARGTVSGNPTTQQIQFEARNGDIQSGFYQAESRTEISGSIPRIFAEYDAKRPNDSWKLQIRTDSLDIENPAIPGKLSFQTVLDIQPDRFNAQSFSGKWKQSSFSGKGTIRLPYRPENSISLSLSSGPIEFQQIMPLLPEGIIPDAMDISGQFSVEDLAVSGTVANPHPEGTINFHQVNTTPPGLNKSLNVSNEILRLAGNTLHVNNWTPTLGEEPINVSGSLQYRPGLNGSLRVETEQMSLATVLNSLEPRPQIPSTWSPKGNVKGKATVSITPDATSVAGSLRLPELHVGKITGTNGRASFSYGSDQLNISSLSMDLYGGKWTGSGKITDLSSRPRFQASNQLQSVQLETILGKLAGIGEGSKGDFSLESNLNGSLEQLTRMSGQLGLSGDSIALKNIPAVNNLDQAIIDGITGALGQDLGPIIQAFIGTSLRNYKQDLRRVFAEDVISRIDRVQSRLELEDGKGTLKNTFLENRFLRFQTDGTIGLDGRLDTKLSLKEKEPLIARARQDWLKDLLRQGLPPFRIKGTIMNPEYDMNSFRKDVLKTITSMAVSGSSGEKKSAEDKLKERLLKDLFD